MMSLILHGLLLMSLLLGFDHAILSTSHARNSTIKTYLIVGELPAVTQSLSTQQTSPDKRISMISSRKTALKPAKKHPSTRQVSKRTAPSERTQVASIVKHGTASSELQALSMYLYRKIARHAHYPSGVSRLGASPQVLLQFTVYPDGHINGAHVVESSGSASVDAAALKALNHSLPFNQASRWLHQPQPCRLMIHFSV
ncbi:MAG TPA: hypothetical protein DCL40_01980 [Coxiellaceae bacterium]|nr:hypothetical protein [Coxiellaceae bacterium]